MARFSPVRETAQSHCWPVRPRPASLIGLWPDRPLLRPDRVHRARRQGRLAVDGQDGRL